MARLPLAALAAALLTAGCISSGSYDDGYQDGYEDGYEAAQDAVAEELSDLTEATGLEVPIDLVWESLWAEESQENRDAVCRAIDSDIDRAVDVIAQGFADDVADNPDLEALSDSERDLLAETMQDLCREHEGP